MASKLAAVVVSQPMMDDQKTVIHWQALEADGSAGAFPTGASVVNAVDNPALATLDGSVDASGINVGVVGVKKSAGGVVKVTGTYTNPDGTTAVGEVDLTISIDPAELDIASLGATVDPPVAQ